VRSPADVRTDVLDRSPFPDISEKCVDHGSS